MTLPSFEITTEILTLSNSISLLLGRCEGLGPSGPPDIKLSRQNRARSIHASLSIEGNSLSIEQVGKIIDGQSVLGPLKDIREAQNAADVYSQIESFKSDSEKHFLNAHGIMMDGLIPKPGKYRQANVGIFQASKVRHVAPKANLVPKLMGDLFKFVKKGKGPSLLVNSAIFHYELEFIHPFTDGNGRMGRFWQQLILKEHHAVFLYIPVESMIQMHQGDYYQALRKSDKSGQCTEFIEFSLAMIKNGLQEYIELLLPKAQTVQDRLLFAKTVLKENEFSRLEYQRVCKDVASATASRDLRWGVDQGILKKSGEMALTKYRFKG